MAVIPIESLGESQALVYIEIETQDRCFPLYLLVMLFIIFACFLYPFISFQPLFESNAFLDLNLNQNPSVIEIEKNST